MLLSFAMKTYFEQNLTLFTVKYFGFLYFVGDFIERVYRYFVLEIEMCHIYKWNGICVTLNLAQRKSSIYFPLLSLLKDQNININIIFVRTPFKRILDFNSKTTYIKVNIDNRVNDFENFSPIWTKKFEWRWPMMNTFA